MAHDLRGTIPHMYLRPSPLVCLVRSTLVETAPMWLPVCWEHHQGPYWVCVSFTHCSSRPPWSSECRPGTSRHVQARPGTTLCTLAGSNHNLSLSPIITGVHHVFICYSPISQHSTNPRLSWPQLFNVPLNVCNQIHGYDQSLTHHKYCQCGAVERWHSPALNLGVQDDVYLFPNPLLFVH